MIQIRVHGRGGQGVVTAAEILSVAAFLEGKHAQAFPTFGSERMGAPVTAFCRISDIPIKLREPIGEPDILIVQDATLLRHVPVFAGIVDSGFVLINSTKQFSELNVEEFVRKLDPDHCDTIPATSIALEHVGRPIPNAALLGGLVGMTGVLKIESIIQAIKQKFPGSIGEKNVAAAQAACALMSERKVTHVTAN